MDGDADDGVSTNTAVTANRKLFFDALPRHRVDFTRRKFSFPTLSSAASSTSATTPAGLDGVLLNKRRFSNVGDVTRKLSTTIGWRTVTVPVDDVVTQGRVLCGQFIRNRLKRSGIFNKKLGLYSIVFLKIVPLVSHTALETVSPLFITVLELGLWNNLQLVGYSHLNVLQSPLRLTSTVGSASATVVREVMPSLICAGIEIERTHPRLYSNVARQATLTPGALVLSGKAAATLMMAIGQELFKGGDVNWGKIVSLFAIAGGLSVDCVCQGHPEFLHGIVDGVVEVLENELAEWIANNGGWTSLSNQCKHPNEEITTVEYATIAGLALTLLFVIYFVVKFFWQFDYS